MTTIRPEPLLYGECRCPSPCADVVCATYLEGVRELVRVHMDVAARGCMLVSSDDEGRVVHRGRVGALGPLRFVTRGVWARHVARAQPAQQDESFRKP